VITNKTERFERRAGGLNAARPGSVQVDVIDLQLCHLPAIAGYDLQTEVAAANTAATASRPPRRGSCR
jgi:hypothetical protein